MLQQYHTKLKGTLALTDSYLTEKALQKEKGLYKFCLLYTSDAADD